MKNELKKESNFASAVIYLNNNALKIENFLQNVNAVLSEKFQSYEIVVVNDASKDGGVQIVKEFAQKNAVPLTLVNMSTHQGCELCMNAGVDACIGDFVYEFDTCETQFDFALLNTAYTKALSGFDIVTVSPKKNRNVLSNLFYFVFNLNFNAQHKLQTDAFRLLSRRAINRVRSISQVPAYRKAAYAASGLKIHVINDESVRSYENRSASPSSDLALNSLMLYTTTAFKFSFFVSSLMFFLAIGELIYTLIIYFGFGSAIEGWTTTMFVLTVGFCGVFVILTMVLKYLSLLVNLVFKQQRYLVESVEKF